MTFRSRIGYALRWTLSSRSNPDACAMTLNGLESQIKRMKLIDTSDSDVATAGR